MEQGATVAWLTADDEDEPARFTWRCCSRCAGACGIGGDERLARKPYVEALTGMLSEIASRGTLTVIMIDDAERLPAATVRDVLQYLLLNAPANLHVAIGSRVRVPLQTAELGAKGDYATLVDRGPAPGPGRLDRNPGAALGPRLGLDERARLHEVSEGWPLGLQLALAAVEREPDPARCDPQPFRAARHAAGILRRIAADTIVAGRRRYPGAHRHPRPLRRRTLRSGDRLRDAGAQLDQLVRETPILMADEGVQWFRLHGLARDFLLSRFEQLPRSEQAELHARASRSFAVNDVSTRPHSTRSPPAT